MNETHDPRLKRIRMRAMRRGTREMDILLGHYVAAHLVTLAAPDLDVFEALLDENDQDLYQWVTGQIAPPSAYADLVAGIAAQAVTPGYSVSTSR